MASMKDTKKAICLHFHIFKNAGTTIDTVLEDNFSKDAIRMDVDKPADILPVEIVMDYLKKNPNVKAFSSHQIRFPLPKNNLFNFIPMVFIRHPIDRILSIYNFNKRRSDVRTIGVAQAKNSTLKEYIEWNFKNKTLMIMKNFQVLYLSRQDTKSLSNSNDLDLAINRLKSCPIVGIVDRLDESLFLAEDVLRKFFPKINLSYVSQNVNQDRKELLEERLDEAKKEIGISLWNELMEKNSLDMKLYSFVCDELERRKKTIVNFEEKLIRFKNREIKKKHSVLKYLSPFKNRRIWYSPEKRLLYQGSFNEGKQKILYYLRSKDFKMTTENSRKKTIVNPKEKLEIFNNAKNKLSKARNKFLLAKEQVKEAREELNKSKGEFDEARKKFLKAKK